MSQPWVSFVLGVLVCAGCSGGNELDAPVPGVDFDCNTAIVDGIYEVSFHKRSGTCPQPQPILVQLPVTQGVLDLCYLDVQVSPDQCTLEENGSCAARTAPRTPAFDYVSTLTVATADGSRLTGVAQYTYFDSTGAVICWGSYELTFVRQ